MTSREKMLAEGKINHVLKVLAVPATIAMFVNAMYNIVDTIFIGRGVGAMGIAGVAIYLPIQMFMIATAQLVGIGAASYISRLIGERDYKKVNLVAGNAMILMILIGAVFTTIGLIYIDKILILFGAIGNIFPYAKEYAFIMIFGILFHPFVVMCCALIRSEGNTKDATYSMFLGFLSNIILDYFFIFPLNMGIKGAAFATILAKFFQLIYIIFYLNSGKTIFKIKLSDFRLQGSIIKNIVSIGASAFILVGAESIVAIVINNSLAYYGGEIYLSIYGIIYKIILFTYMPLRGITQGIQPIIGYNYGAKKLNRVKETVKLSIIITVIIGTISCILGELFPGVIVSIFTINKEIILKSKVILRIVMIFIPLMGVPLIATTFYQSIGRVGQSLFFSLLRQIILFIPLALILPNINNLKVWGLWFSFPISDFLSMIITSMFLLKEVKKYKKKI
ncbi:MATE family efflux transporter [Clostridium oceanicum]|uniref:Multidrug export protein MepA n=1 Tax=Clostridium oceanicum TaxID=1543 RepID=A0ABP3UMQ2_9CLOT